MRTKQNSGCCSVWKLNLLRDLFLIRHFDQPAGIKVMLHRWIRHQMKDGRSGSFRQTCIDNLPVLSAFFADQDAFSM